MTLKIAVVGTGKVARNNYLPYLAKQPDTTLRYFSRTPERAEDCARDFGGTVFPSVEALLADQPDAVLVLTHETQRADATEALLAGRPKRLFFEKPLVAKNGQAHVSEDDFLQARSLLQRAEAIGSETAMVFNYRFFAQTQRAQAILAERDFGKLTQASLLVNYACWSHCIDLLQLFGGRAAEVAALAGTTEHQGALDLSGAFRLENGATGTVLGTSGTKFDHSLYELHFAFERGSLHFSDLDGPLEIWDHATRYKETHGLIGNHSRWDQYRLSFEKSLAAYLESIRQGAPPPIPGRAGLEELQFEAALRRSVALQRPVQVQEELGLLLPG
ncbi:Gfo/Idh/MocA family protein [Armatimonas rosea]|uniref:Putative dehydrogenase n=1 Tax=Armatimonas rosea TaxID=685828 RepID=A0A7W9W5L5_ARMRO|nr:Gfo/Idh/MocA family oxidoreductase [Armatimonas rosea]MBB6050599.1 putative dehydrogenase [Armatimonas rosea]